MIYDFAELFQGGFLVFDDFLGEHVGIGKAVGFFEACVFEKASRRTINKIVQKRKPDLHNYPLSLTRPA